jgi:hypothetical protein
MIQAAFEVHCSLQEPKLQEVPLPNDTLQVTCPICGRKAEYSMEALIEGSTMTCPFCRVKLNLHGHMWKEIQEEMAKLKEQK